MRIYVERAWGFHSNGARRFPGFYDAFDDVTDQPMRTVTSRPVHVVCVPEPGDPGYLEES